MNDLKRRRESDLELRKRRQVNYNWDNCYRLAAMLEAEDRQYEQEFMANLETPEQVREKMAQRLWELKEKRENERQNEVNRRLDQRFKDSNP